MQRYWDTVEALAKEMGGTVVKIGNCGASKGC